MAKVVLNTFSYFWAFGGLSILWNPLTIQGNLIQQQKKLANVAGVRFECFFYLINVYGHISTQDKLKIWDKLAMLIQLQNSHQGILGGDFNAILNQNEKVGGIFPPIKTIQDFAQFVENNDLMDIQPSNGKFTLTNRRSVFAKNRYIG